MSEKYISVFAAIQAKPEFLNENHENKDSALYAKGWNACNKEYIDNLLDIPAEDVRPVKEGHWISAYDGSVVSINSDGCPEVSCHCSECGDWLTASDEYYAKGRFCPNCGAKMGGTP